MAATCADRFARAERRVVRDDDIVDGLLREADGVDLIVTGGSDAGLLERLLGLPVPQQLVERTRRPVIAVHEMAAQPRRWIL